MAPSKRLVQAESGNKPPVKARSNRDRGANSVGEFLEGLCMHRWKVLNSGSVHTCTRLYGHMGNHRCACANVVLDDTAHQPVRVED